MSHQQPGPAVPARRAKNGSPLAIPTRSNRSGLEHLARVFAEARPVAVVTGERESDTSCIIDHFLASIDGGVTVMRVTGPFSDSDTIMREVMRATGFDTENVRLTDLENEFTNYIYYQRYADRRTIICFEEIKDADWRVLDRARLLVELEMKEQLGLMVILSGRLSLNNLLVGTPFDATGARTRQPVALVPFTLVETREHIWREIKKADIADISQVIEFDAITLIHDLTAGVSVNIDTLCCKCIWMAYEEGAGPITTVLVKEADKLLKQMPVTKHPITQAGSTKINGASPSTGHLIARMHGVIVRERALNQGHILIGRGKLCDLPVNSPVVSRHHALVVNSSIGVRLVDLGSTNGTFVDGHQIDEYALQNGDEIAVGDCTIAYVTDNDRRA